MIGQHPRMIAKGPFGTWIPAFAYDLTGKELSKNARSNGLVRYGKTPDGDEDTRPIGLPFAPSPQPVDWVANGDSPDLIQLEGSSLAHQVSAVPNQAKSYISNLFIGENAGWFLKCVLDEHAKSQQLKLHQWRWGVAGRGYLFQIRGGTPEIACLSDEFNESDLAALHVLWASEDPSVEETTQINDLVAKLFVNFESLSFERGLGKGDWYNTPWTISFVPEPRGILHIVLAGADATAHENPTLLEARVAGIMWNASKVEMFSGGGSFYMETGPLLFAHSAKMEFGPFATAYWEDSLGAVSFAKNAYYEAGKTNLVFEMLEYEGLSINFGFRAELQSLNRTQTPWLYGLSARLAPGIREVSETIVFDTDDLYVEIGGDGPKEKDPILEIEVFSEGLFLERTVKVIKSDVLGWTSNARILPRDRLATVTIDDDPLITEGMVATLEQTNMRALAREGVVTVRNDDQFLAGGDSALISNIKDGWYMLKQFDCDPPPINDNAHLSDAFRAFLAAGGYTGARVNVPVGVGKRVSKAALGEDWAERPDADSKVADAVKALFENYGYGWIPYMDRFNVWQMRRPLTEPIASFSSSGIGLNIHTEEGRLMIFKPIDILHDRQDFYNDFIVYGGKNGEIVKRYTNWGSINNPNADDYIGYKKTYKIRNTGLATEDDVDYALLSAKWFYGRSGRRAQFETFFHRQFDPGDLILCDGLKWEIEGQCGGSWAKDTANFNVIQRN